MATLNILFIIFDSPLIICSQPWLNENVNYICLVEAHTSGNKKIYKKANRGQTELFMVLY